jgi:hypothetical protein
MTGKSYVRFVELPPFGIRKTSIYNVVSESSGDILGTIKWYGPWRQYCFWPRQDSEDNYTWSSGCLTEIVSFLKKIMEARR